jgi:hypothetical protein
MAISRMQEPQQIRSGIGSLQDPRQGYFLGKLVKKAVRGVKKIVKSPLGKAAIIGGLGMIPFGASKASLFSRGLGALKGIGAARSMPAMLTRGMGGTPARSGFGGFLSSLNPFGGNFSGKNAFLTGGALLTAAPFLMNKFGGDEEVEEDVDVMDIAGIRKRAKDFYRGATDTGLNFMPGKQFVQPNFYAAAGGRAMLNMGGAPGEQQAEQMLMAEFVKYKNRGGTLSFEQFVKAVMQASQQPEGAGMEQPQPVAMAANGGRIGYQDAGPVVDEETMTMIVDMKNRGMDIDSIATVTETPVEVVNAILSSLTQQADGGRIGKQEGGIMDTEASEMIDMGGMEKDYRNTGGFVEMGGKERADDVPARLSKNEFVFTADAVRNAGGGDIDKGAEVMENLMNNLEQGGEVSEDSQGLEGAQRMYDQQQMLQSRIA